ncbi:hypothetical protein KKH18_08770 [bacterium]|nr:hypothetical protein [bacterium]
MKSILRIQGNHLNIKETPIIVRLLVLLCAATLVFGYAPQPKVVTQAETEFEAALATAETDEAQIELAKEYLDNYPDNIPLGRSAQNILNRKSDTPPDWYKTRKEAAPTSTNRYLWARASQDHDVMVEQANWMMENDAENFWGYYLAATAEWDTEEPDMDKVIGYFEQALAKDPAQYTGYLWLGYAYEDANKPEQALEVFKAAKIVDPEDDSPKQAMLGLYAQMKDADEYFELVTPMLPTNPVTVELPVAKSTADLNTVKLNGEYTVLDCFAQWCGPCVKMSLPEWNELTAQNEMPFKLYAVHAEGENEAAHKLLDSTDVNGKDWSLTFLWGTEEFRNQLGGVHAFPSYYILDEKAVPRALILGHSNHTRETLSWLIDEVKKRSS